MSQAPPNAPAPLDTEPVPGDADDTRGRHFRTLAATPVAVIATVLAAVAGFVVGLVLAGVLAGLGGALLAILIVVGIVFAIASGRAEDDFFKAYASARGLVWVDAESRLPQVTPLLRKGEERRTELHLEGRWPSGFQGRLAHYTYTEVTRDSKGRRQETDYDFTVAMTAVRDFAPYLAELYVQRRVGFRFLDSAEDAFRTRQRVEHESEALDRRFEVFIGRRDEMNRALQVLSPTFVVWLSEHTPENFAFECCAGSLVCAVTGHRSSAVELDGLAEAANAVATRLREEAAE